MAPEAISSAIASGSKPSSSESTSKLSPPINGAGLRGPLLAPNRGFTCADGMLMVTAGTDGQFAKLCRVLDCEELLSDPDYATNNARMANEAALTAFLNARFITGNREYWWQKLRGADVPSAPIQTLEEAVNHDHTLASGVLQPSPDGGQTVVGLPLRFDGERPGYRRSAPALNEGTEDLRSELNKDT